MKVQVTNKTDKTVVIVEMHQIPCEGDRFEAADGSILHVVEVTHAPFAKDVAARVVVGPRNSMGLA